MAQLESLMNKALLICVSSNKTLATYATNAKKYAANATINGRRWRRIV